MTTALRYPLDVVLAQIASKETGEAMHSLMAKLWPICRSLTGQGVRDTLDILATEMPSLERHEVQSGQKCFDWVVPDEWNIKDAYIVTPSGSRICELRHNNLHVMGYSVPIDQELSLEELQCHLYSLPTLPQAIPYVTSYYTPRWGFCLSEIERRNLQPGTYRAVIDSTLAPGKLNFADLIIEGESDDEVLCSTYICHPSMANNELSGPVVATYLVKWLLALPRRRYTYRFVFIPETIGSIAYLSQHIQHLKKKVIAGFMINCVGDERSYGFMPSRAGNSLSDRAAQHALRHHVGEYESHSFVMRGSDERQYCSPGIDLPIASLFRSKYDTYPEYHTSLDDMTFVTPAGLTGGLQAFQRSLQAVEANRTFRAQILGEPNLGSRGLYPTLSTKETFSAVFGMINTFAYSDGSRDLIDIADLINQPIWELAKAARDLEVNNLIG